MIYIDNVTIKQDVYIPRTDGLGCVESSPYVTEADVERIVDEVVDEKMGDYTLESDFSAHTADTSIHFTSAAVETQIQSALTPYYTSAQTDTAIQNALSGLDLSDYYTSAQTDTAITNATSGKVDSSTLDNYYTSGETDTAIQEAISQIPPVDLSDYYNSAQTNTAIQNATSGKVDTTTLGDYYTSAQTQEYVQNAISGVDLSNYYTSAQTDQKLSAITSIIEEDEEVVSRALNELHEQFDDYYTSAETQAYVQSAITSGVDLSDYYTSAETDTKIAEAVSGIDLSNYYTSAQTDTAITNATSGKVDTTTLGDYYTSAETDTAISNAISGIDLTDYYTSAQTDSQISAATSGKQDTLISGTNIKTINNQSLLGSGNITISGGGGGGSNVVELTQAQYDALVDPDPDTIYVITDAPTVDLANFATSADVATISGDVATKATKANVTANSNTYRWPTWNAEGIITGFYGQSYSISIPINGSNNSGFMRSRNSNATGFYAPTSAGTNGQILKSTGSGAPSWVSPNDAGIPTSTGILNIVACTQQEYDNMASHPATTLFVITD